MKEAYIIKYLPENSVLAHNGEWTMYESTNESHIFIPKLFSLEEARKFIESEDCFIGWADKNKIEGEFEDCSVWNRHFEWSLVITPFKYKI